jgi:hypothetical protein
MHWWPSNHTGAESGLAFNGDWAGWEMPRRWRGQGLVDRRGARQTHKTRRAWVFHTLEALKSQWTGGRRCVDWRRGALGAAIHWWLSKLCGLGALVAKSVSLPNAWRLLFLGVHLFTRCRTLYPTLPLFPVFRKLIPPSDIFEVKISSARRVACDVRLTRSSRFFLLEIIYKKL